ncbi:LysR family transcriptional regulator [Sphingomonas melonis]|uniref:DNA-binding transcriptional LysR family regulator n=1 Tax=Sphingomonas melonis TaxID=152682 RepID=A0A7Y9FQD0_9SPHN|nr:LysR family transcriptional regulator [Sphingomonas melonis]NYD90331.1 DNA-binding transcriptional LysR family regulator [Sphingomonas melonis]
MAFDPDYALFVAVADGGSLSAAARGLGISPAMVSKRLQRLENRLGVSLVHRTTRRLVLTEAGARFRDDLAEVVAALGAAEARVTGARDAPAGPLRVSAPTSFGRLHVAPHLGAFLAAYPAVDLRFDLSDRFVDLLGERVDCAIRIARAVPDALVAHRLGESRRILCAAPAYLADHGQPATIRDLARHRLLAADGQMPWRLAAGSRNVAIDHVSHVRTNSSEMVRELALGGVGIALRSLWDVGDALRDGRLVRVLPDWEGSAEVGIFAVHLRSPMVSAAVGAFVAFLHGTIDPARWEE